MNRIILSPTSVSFNLSFNTCITLFLSLRTFSNLTNLTNLKSLYNLGSRANLAIPLEESESMKYERGRMEIKYTIKNPFI